ncbi:MAG: guanylate kinase [Victivallaceae bacterium]
MSEQLGSLIVVSGPSGVGKSTVCKIVRENLPELEFSVSCTTRRPRPGEVHGREYYFITPEEFESRIADEAFVEYAGVFDNYYGTLKSEVIDRVKAGKDVFLDIDVQGAMQIQQAAKNDQLLGKVSEFIFIGPPSLAELERRLRGRGTENAEQLALRLSKSKTELAYWKKYNYLIINDQVDNAAEEMLGLIRSFRLKTSRMADDKF